MAEADELDQADEEMQPDLFGAEPVPAYRPDPERVRARLHKILAEARAAQSCRGRLGAFPFIVRFFRR